ncbi:Cof-type HAD-IIB family hydrolase [Paenibacillus abyssi]|uniref:5-amino-6-(5-phospho-D-ribitylamino)uracil phosphatase YcsE n=1 Tax=Paenibacillus abyssi TaxID=1340531 RepID=A0A917CSY3_9BACL|nr:Cof-type HAD-IIB family hydrolase [Paenibacillus abyssi]GGF96742.1 5-amino-6-(5-phospho-D-ribitylamino)uracil phosphatase YcsE [Paenibacillus abyssi]
MGKYKLVALDMDGTLLNDRSEISKENAAWIHKALDSGVTVCFSTGRGFRSALPYAEQLELDTPMITVNGSEIWHKPHVLHQRTYMSEAVLGRLQQLAQQYETWYWAYTIEDVYNKEKWIGSDETLEEKHWLKFGFDTPDDAVRAKIRREIESWGGLEITNSSTTNIEINPQGVSKANAIREVCRLLDVDMSQVIAVGDSLNDLAAIREAGLGVAMGNAQDEVKAAADVVTVTNNEDAIARVIEQYVL